MEVTKLIRNCEYRDLEQVNKSVSMEIDDFSEDLLFDIYNNSKEFIVWEDETIYGFAYVTLTNESKREWKLGIFVDSQYRNNGIGSELYKEIETYITSKPSIIVTEFRVDLNDSGYFFKKLGYKKWYGSPELHYRGTYQPTSDLEFIQFQDNYYEEYAKLRQECFYEMSVKYDFKPYIIPLSEEDRNYLLGNKDLIYLTFDNGRKLIGAITINNGYLDHIMVSPEYQGRGYGKKITQFGINKELSQLAEVIQLCYIEGNIKAEKLYKALGFEVVCNTHVYRKFI